MRLSHIVLAGFAVLAVALPSPSALNDPASASSSPISLTNIISIKRNNAKVERAAELLTAFIEKVKENEPGVQVFELDLDRNRSQFLTFEVYKDQEAVDIHLKSPYLAELQAAEQKEKLKRAENQVYFLDLITRFLREPIEPNV
ncbi:MAG: hypothetical protein Q9167_004841 [Letrouitia subvulpina]